MENHEVPAARTVQEGYIAHDTLKQLPLCGDLQVHEKSSDNSTYSMKGLSALANKGQEGTGPDTYRTRDDNDKCLVPVTLNIRASLSKELDKL